MSTASFFLFGHKACDMHIFNEQSEVDIFQETTKMKRRVDQKKQAEALEFSPAERLADQIELQVEEAVERLEDLEEYFEMTQSTGRLEAIVAH
jgi:hypothetical protein